jgi:hypothetical protein
LFTGVGEIEAQASRKVLDAELPPHGRRQSGTLKSAKDETRAYRSSLHYAGERHVVAFSLARVNDIGNGVESSPRHWISFVQRLEEMDLPGVQ